MSHGTFGIISPHPPIFVPAVGGREALVAHASTDALDTARDALRRYSPDTVVLMSPHAPAAADAILVDGSDAFEGSLSQFDDMRVRQWPGDPDFASMLVRELDAAGVPVMLRPGDARLRAGWLDHATIVPLSFLDPEQQLPIVILSLSYLPLATHRELGRIVHLTAEKTSRRVAFVASGDCSHRLTPDAPAGYSPRGAVFDKLLVELIGRGALSELVNIDQDLRDDVGECGLRSFVALGGFSGDDPVPTRVLAYEGPWGVGYLTALVGQAALDVADTAEDGGEWPEPHAGRKGGMPGRDESEIVRLARHAVEAYIRRGTLLESHVLSDEPYPARAGAFVSLHRRGELRGCIGTISPTADTLAEEVVHNAIEAAARDPRFPSLDESELGDLDIKVDVLHASESCTLDDLDPARYGVIVTSGWHRGLLLPDLEGVDDVATQVAIAMRKAGIPAGSSCDIERFKVDRYT